MMNSMKKAGGVMACLILSGCAATWNATLPAISKQSYDLQVLRVRPPLDPTWRLLKYDEYDSEVIFLHAGTGDKLAAWWVPVSPEEVAQTKEATVLSYFKEIFLENLQVSGDYDLKVITSEKWPSSASNGGGRILYLKGLQQEKQNFEAWVVYREKEVDRLPVIEVFSYSRVLKSEREAAGPNPETTQVSVLKRFAEFSSPGKMDSQQVMSQRAHTAYDRFRILSEKRGQTKEKERLAAAHQAAKREVQSALSLLADWPEIHDMAGLLASYNKDYEFFGKDFDATSAEKFYRVAIGKRKNFIHAHFHLARMYQALEKWKEALEQYQELSEISPNSSDYYYEQGKLHEKLGQSSHALAAYKQANRYWIGATETHKELEQKIKALEKTV